MNKLQAFTWRYVDVYNARHNKLTLYLRSACLAVNKITVSTRILLRYLLLLLSITAGIMLKISNVCHRQCWFYEKFNILTVLKVIKNEDVIEMHGAQYFLLFYLKAYTSPKLLFHNWCMILNCWVMNSCTKYMNVFVSLFPTTMCVVILLLFVDFTRVLPESKLSMEIY